MMVLGARSEAGWWIATGSVVLLIGVILFAGSSLITPFLPGGAGSVKFHVRQTQFRPSLAFASQSRIAHLSRLDYPKIDAHL
jgi:hypothetical protein